MAPREFTNLRAAVMVLAVVTRSPAIAQSVPAESVPAELRTCRSYCVRDYGAAGDARSKDTQPIQRAIDQAAWAGGGVVLFPSGRYLSGTLVLRSGVALRLEAGATLLASTELSDYRIIRPAFESRTSAIVNPSLIYAENCQNVSVSGEGVIDGRGGAFEYGPDRLRPYVLRFVSCQNVHVEGLTLRNSPGWMQHYLACDDVTIRGLRVLSHANYNNDMVDVDCCRNVRIVDCIGDTGDDAITLKSTGNRICENVTIANCIVASHCNAIKLGTESNGGFRDITISNCVIRPSTHPRTHHGLQGGLAGIALEIVDGGVMERVAINNITMSGVAAPLFLRLGNRARPVREGLARPKTGRMRHIAIDNVVATEAGETGCAVAGLMDHPIEDVSLSNISISMAGGVASAPAPGGIPEKAEASPECTMFGVLPAYGLFCRHVEGLRLRNIRLRWSSPDRRSALVFDDVRELDLDGFNAAGLTEGAPTLVLHDVRGALIRGCVAPRGVRVFLRMEGDTDRVSMLGNDLAEAEIPFEFEESRSRSVLHPAGNRLKP